MSWKEASKGSGAVSLCGGLQLDAVLIDLLMPGKGGVVTTKAIDKSSRNHA